MGELDVTESVAAEPHPPSTLLLSPFTAPLQPAGTTVWWGP